MNRKGNIRVIVADNISKEQAIGTLEEARNEVQYYSEKLKNVELNSSDVRKIFSELYNNGVISTPEKLAKGQLTPKNISNHFSYIISTSGTTGEPKRFPYTFFGDGLAVYEAFREYALKDFEKGSIFTSGLPPPPSISGLWAYTVFFYSSYLDGHPVHINQIPISLLQQQNLPRLIEFFKLSKPEYVGMLLTTLYNVVLLLPEDVRKNIRVVTTGSEEVTTGLAQKILSLLPNAEIINIYGSSEGGIAAIERINKSTLPSRDMKPTHSVFLVLEEEEEASEVIGRLYPTKIIPQGHEKIPKALLGTYLINHDIGDKVRINQDGKIVRIYRETEEGFSLAGAKLHFSQLADIIYSYPEFKDFVAVYKPISPNNPTPELHVKVGYLKSLQKPPVEQLKEAERRLYEINRPVDYEVNVTKMAKIKFELIPEDELEKLMYPKPGKPRRVIVINE